MNWIEYQEKSIRTLASVEELYSISTTDENLKELFWKADLAHMSMGMASELNELEEAVTKKDKINIFEEIGDIYWYLSGQVYILKNKFDIPDMITNYHESMVNKVDITKIKSLDILVSINTDYVKKMFIYRKEKKRREIIDELIVNISDIQIALSLECLGYNFDESEVLERNIAKLSARYPEKFTQEKAIDRDIDNEREVLEGN